LRDGINIGTTRITYTHYTRMYTKLQMVIVCTSFKEPAVVPTPQSDRVRIAWKNIIITYNVISRITDVLYKGT
jgi:hypothetical protein